MKNGVNDMPSNMTSIDFDLIRGWISEHLKTPNDIVRSEGRNVIVNTEFGLKSFTIPKLTEINKEDWKKSWLNVYKSCLDALQLKVNRIYVVGRREGYIVQVSPNEIRVGVSIIKISDDYGSVAYARALEKIINTYNKLKSEEARRVKESSINVNHSTINIGDSNKMVTNMYKVNSNMVSAKKETVKPIVADSKELGKSRLNDFDCVKAPSVKSEPVSNDDNTVKSVRMAMPSVSVKEPVEKVQVSEENKKQVVIQKIPDNVSLDKTDCEEYRDQSLVIATCMSVKNGDGIFRDNIDIIRDTLPNVTIGSFISGKSTNLDQAVKESNRMLKLLNDCKVSKLVIYEINNDYVISHLKKKEDIILIMQACLKICDDLVSSNYYPIVCMDFDTYENLRSVAHSYLNKYPVIKCVTPKQKDMVSNKDDILYMNPSKDTDALMVSNINMQTNIGDIPRNTIKESLNAQAA